MSMLHDFIEDNADRFWALANKDKNHLTPMVMNSKCSIANLGYIQVGHFAGL